MTFILHHLSHYNSITESRAWFLLSLLEDISIDFPSHFILSLIDVYKDTATRDKLIFPSTITQILCHFSVSYLESTHFSIMCAINTATVRRSEAQLRSKRPQTETATPLASSAPSTFAPSSSVGRVTLEAITWHNSSLSVSRRASMRTSYAMMASRVTPLAEDEGIEVERAKEARTVVVSVEARPRSVEW